MSWWKRHGLGSDPEANEVKFGLYSDEDLRDMASYASVRCGTGTAQAPELERSLDTIHHPIHYTKGKIEVIEFIEDQQFGYHESNVIKYVSRARWKGKELSDLKKARWYLDRKIKLLEKT